MLYISTPKSIDVNDVLTSKIIRYEKNSLLLVLISVTANSAFAHTTTESSPFNFAVKITDFGVSLAQQTVTGVVTDENGTALPGVNDLIKGTVRGAVTGFGGNYQRGAFGHSLINTFRMFYEPRISSQHLGLNINFYLNINF